MFTLNMKIISAEYASSLKKEAKFKTRKVGLDHEHHLKMRMNE